MKEYKIGLGRVILIILLGLLYAFIFHTNNRLYNFGFGCFTATLGIHLRLLTEGWIIEREHKKKDDKNGKDTKDDTAANGGENQKTEQET